MAANNSIPHTGITLEELDQVMVGVIDQLFDVRAMALAANEFVCEQSENDEALSAGRVIRKVAAMAETLAEDIDAAMLAVKIGGAV
ncbi:MAG: hypothetical protein KBF54_05955 [Rhizobiales bacterium]|jgi:hypothetical protein|nr:hypothetical protein [Hyphomicrobiales bacterium]